MEFGVGTNILNNATTTYDFQLPTTSGSVGQVLTSQGGAAPMTWTTPTTGTVTSVAMTVPSILSVTGSPITSSGTFAVTTTNTPTGTGSIVLATSPTLVTPILGVASCTSITASSFVAALGTLAESTSTAGAYLGMSGSSAKIELVSSSNTQSGFIDFATASPEVSHVGRILYTHTNNRMELMCTLNTPVLQLNPSTTYTNVTSGTVSLFRLATRSVIIMSNATNNITLESAGVTSDYSWRYPSSAGSSGQVLTSQGGATAMTWTTPTTGTVTSVAMTVPSILTVTGSPITSSGTFAITTTNTPTGTGSIVLATSPTLVTPTLGVATGTSLGLSGGLSMADSRVFLRSLGDNNHSLYWLTGLDGLVLTGLGGGRLASGTAAATTSLSWNTSGVSIPGTIVLGTTNTTTIINAASSSYSFRLPTTAGTAGQVLTSQGGGSPMTWTTAGAGGTVTSVAMTVPSILSVSGSPITSSGIF